MRIVTLACTAMLGAAPALAAIEQTQTIEITGPLAAHALTDVDGDGDRDLVVIGRDGVVRLWTHAEGDGLVEANGTLALPDPAHSLVAFADLLGAGAGRQLVVASPAGVRVWDATATGGFEGEPAWSDPQTRFDMRTRWPRLANIAPDLDSDDRADLVLPDANACHLWLNRPEDGQPRLAHAGAFDIEVNRSRSTRADNLSDELREIFSLPTLRRRDVNGDGRPDLVLGDDPVHAFHMQRPDGTFPVEPDVRLDLTRFQDTMRKPDSMFGGTAVLGEDPVSYSRDLDGDDIPDYVIAHRRMVWVFHGTEDGPQFVTPRTFRVDEDISYLIVAELNDDDRPDLLIFKVLVPSEAELVLGMLGPLTIEVRASGYANLDGRTFEETPSWRRRLELRLPPIASMLRNPQHYVKKFTDAMKEIPTSRRGDFNGDEKKDVVILRDEPARMDVWYGTEAGDSTPNADRLLREVLFEHEQDTVDLDRMLELIQWAGNLETGSITQGREPDGTAPLRAATDRVLQEIAVGDLTGNGRDEIVAIYEATGVARDTTMDVFELTP